MRNCLLTAGLLAALLAELAVGTAHGAIEADPRKEYKLTERHGPWMIMVASFAGTERQEDGRDAAHQLVMALRRAGIPAYTHEQEARREYFSSDDPSGLTKRRVYASQRPGVSVIAGNYESLEDRVGQKTLAWIKNTKYFKPVIKYKSSATKEQKSYTPSLAKAFLTRNPMRGEEGGKSLDPLLLKLNDGDDQSLLKNKGDYTVVVASFYGNAKMKPEGFALWEMKMRSEGNLDTAAEDAWALCKTLKNHPRIRELNLDVWVFHERYRSIVTVGSFHSATDPKIDQVRSVFQAKVKRDDRTKQEFLVAEWVQIPGKAGQPPLKNWILDPEPKLMEVPKASNRM